MGTRSRTQTAALLPIGNAADKSRRSNVFVQGVSRESRVCAKFEYKIHCSDAKKGGAEDIRDFIHLIFYS